MREGAMLVRMATTDWAESDVELADGATLHVYRRGQGPPVVLAHGATDNCGAGPGWPTSSRATTS